MTCRYECPKLYIGLIFSALETNKKFKDSEKRSLGPMGGALELPSFTPGLSRPEGRGRGPAGQPDPRFFGAPCKKFKKRTLFKTPRVVFHLTWTFARHQ